MDYTSDVLKGVRFPEIRLVRDPDRKGCQWLAQVAQPTSTWLSDPITIYYAPSRARLIELLIEGGEIRS